MSTITLTGNPYITQNDTTIDCEQRIFSPSITLSSDSDISLWRTNATEAEKQANIRCIKIKNGEIEDVYKNKLDELNKYKDSLNYFKINGTKVGWLTPLERADFKNYVEAEVTLNPGCDVVNISYNIFGMTLNITSTEAFTILATLAKYAGDCSKLTASKIEEIKALSEEQVNNYDITSGYPEAPNFNI